MLIAFHKPYGVLSQFTDGGTTHRTLAAFGLPARVYPIGRLDTDSEGLLLLSDEGAWNRRLLDPDIGHEREYWVQVEGRPGPEAFAALAAGVSVQGKLTRPARAWPLQPPPVMPPRDPPIRHRLAVPDAWIALALREGRNRQVRRMTAAVGHPTLRLVRVRIGEVQLRALVAGEWRVLSAGERARLHPGSG